MTARELIRALYENVTFPPGQASKRCYHDGSICYHGSMLEHEENGKSVPLQVPALRASVDEANREAASPVPELQAAALGYEVKKLAKEPIVCSPSQRGDRVTRQCRTCGRSFTTTKSEAGRGKGFYCSLDCSGTGRRTDLIGHVTAAGIRVVARGRIENKRYFWVCQCFCGKEFEATSANLKRQRSCGCLARAHFREIVTTHGLSAIPEYNIWRGMIGRCHCPTNTRWEYYGGRGISVCDEWRHDFSAFYRHIGPRPTKRHSVDRIDNNRGYEPGNVRWATMAEQVKNQRPRRKRVAR